MPGSNLLVCRSLGGRTFGAETVSGRDNKIGNHEDELFTVLQAKLL